MRNVKQYQNKNVFILGADRAGVHSAYLLNKLGAQRITINDNKPTNECPGVNRLVNTFPRINAVMDTADPKLLGEYHYDLLVKASGIPNENPIVQYAKQLQIPIISEITIANYLNIGELDCITGANQDDSALTAKLSTRMLNHFYYDLDHTNYVPRSMQYQHAYHVGNHGTDASLAVEDMKPKDDLVMSYSPKELASVPKMRPYVLAINDLEIKDQATDIAHLVNNQTADDFLIINADDASTKQIKPYSQATVIPVSSSDVQKSGVYVNYGKIYYKKHCIMKATDIKAVKSSQLIDALSAVAIAKIHGCSDNDIIQVLTHK